MWGFPRYRLEVDAQRIMAAAHADGFAAAKEEAAAEADPLSQLQVRPWACAS